MGILSTSLIHEVPLAAALGDASVHFFGAAPFSVNHAPDRRL